MSRTFLIILRRFHCFYPQHQSLFSTLQLRRDSWLLERWILNWFKGSCIGWGAMGYFGVVFWTMNVFTCFGNAIMELWEVIMEVRWQLERSYRMASSALLYLKMQSCMWRVVMYVNRLESHLRGMTFHYILLGNFNLSISGLLILLAPSSNYPNILEPVISTPQSIISPDGKK